MSPTTEDLHRRMSDELKQFPTLPDLAGPALSGGRRRQRRRNRWVAGGGAGLAGLAVVPILLLVGQPDQANDHKPRPSDVATDPTITADAVGTARQEAARLRAEAEADGVVTDEEWAKAVVATFDAVLPPRFGGVKQTSNTAVVEVSTRAGSPRLDFWIALQGYEGKRSLQAASGGCPQVEQAAANSDADWDILDCADARFGNGFQALGTSEWIVSGSQSDTPGVESYAGALLLLNDRLFVQVGITPVGVEAPLSVTADELVQLAQDPDFLDLVRVGVAHTAASKDERAYALPDPVWPG